MDVLKVTSDRYSDQIRNLSSYNAADWGATAHYKEFISVPVKFWSICKARIGIIRGSP